MLNQAKNVFFIGIKGVAMANLAIFLKKMGFRVNGADVDEEFITDKLLKENKTTWQVGFKSLPRDTDLIVYSAAHKGLSNPLTIEAKKRKINIISQAELLGELMKKFKTKIAVSGCHGKTTTSSLLVYALSKLKTKPSYIVGVPFFTGHQSAAGFAKYQGGDFQEKKYFVVEADEYGINPPQDKTPKFLKLSPDWIICTNIDFDHPDVYKNIEETKKAFVKFFNGKQLILNIDDEKIFQCINTLKSKKLVTYGFSKKADYQIVNWKVIKGGSEFEIKSNKEFTQGKMTFTISLFGKHNVSNATAVIVQLLQLGFKTEEIKKAISGFKGAERRFELIYKKDDTYLFDDYAHHPEEIKATIKAARKRFPKKRIIVVFQPHTFSRTGFLLEKFRESLALADLGFILPIFASAREKKTDFKINSKDIVINKKNLIFIEDKEKLVNHLEKTLKKKDVILTMGAGDVYKLKDKLIKIINDKSQITNKFQISNFKFQKNKDISHYLTLRNQVKAELFLEAKTREDLIAAKKYSLVKKLPLFIFGGGSNLAITKSSLPGLIVKNSYIDLKIIKENYSMVIVSVSSGYPVSLLIAKSIQNGWSGFEYHQGLPGTVGGALYMNSKWTKPLNYFGDCLLYANLIDKNGRIKKVNREYFKFAYDYSILQSTKEILLEGVFKLFKDDKEEVKKRAKFALDYRKKTQPFGVASSGCFFKNIKNQSAGYLIDKAGLKNYTIGNYFVSPIHANFIINKGNGKSEDLIKLISVIKRKVKAKFNVDLEEEVIVI